MTSFSAKSLGSAQGILKVVAVALVIFLALYHLTAYPLAWFDEGAYLQAPKTLVQGGVNADHGGDGFRYYAEMVGIGPAVILPIALVFKLWGIGLLQARLVMATYLLATIVVFFRLAGELAGRRFAWVATTLLVTSGGIALLETGRQVLGEVPGLMFVAASLYLWFTAWEKANWQRLVLVGLFLGLAVVTKYQYLLALAPALGLAWLANLVYYRSAPQRVFIIPGCVTAACFGLWQMVMIMYPGTATASENLAALRTATAGAAVVFSPALMKRGLAELLSLKVYLVMLVPALMYGVTLSLPRQRTGHQWGTLWLIVVVNLVWYVVASVSWVRYAFLGLAISSLFVARLFRDVTDGFQIDWATSWASLRKGQAMPIRQAVNWVMLAWLIMMIVLPLGQTAKAIVLPSFNAPIAMATYMNENVPRQALIETWEPEMGFLTDHNYHFPPQLLLNTAVGYIWLNGKPPAQEYHFVETQSPDYVLVGAFSRWVSLYPADWLATHYQSVTRIGGYELFKRNP
jgi:hypothetical protein